MFQELGAFADPSAVQTFAASKLDWSRVTEVSHAQRLSLYRDLIALRRSTPALANGRRDLVRTSSNEEERWLVVERAAPSGEVALAVFNLSDRALAIPLTARDGHYALALSTDAPKYGGDAALAPGEPLVIPRHGSPTVSCPAATARIYLRGNGP